MSDELLSRLFKAIDAKDADGFVACLSEDCSFRFGSAPAVQGHQAVNEAVSAFFQSIAGLSHNLNRRLGDAQTLVVDGDVTYTRHDGSRVTVPFANILELRDDRISDYRIYADISPLYAE